MGLLLSLPLAGVMGTVASSCLAGLAFCFTSTAGRSSRSLMYLPSDLLPSRNYSLYVLQVLQLQLFHRNSHRLCCTISYRSVLTQRFSHSMLDDICVELHARVAYEDPIHDTTY
jgi:hypothetical protein